jgi:WD40 repeat protein
MSSLSTGECLKTYNCHTIDTYSVKILDLARIVTCSHDKTIKIWEIATGQCLKTILTNQYVWGIQILSNNKIASYNEDGRISIWNIEAGDLLKEQEDHDVEICMIKKISDDRLISGSWDNTTKL